MNKLQSVVDVSQFAHIAIMEASKRIALKEELGESRERPGGGFASTPRKKLEEHAMGIAGEWAFCQVLGIPYEISHHEGPDSYDVKVGWYTVDVKADSWTGPRLYMKVKVADFERHPCDYYVLVSMDRAITSARFRGGAPMRVVGRSRIRSFGGHVDDYAIRVDRLYPWPEMVRVFNILRGFGEDSLTYNSKLAQFL